MLVHMRYCCRPVSVPFATLPAAAWGRPGEGVRVSFGFCCRVVTLPAFWSTHVLVVSCHASSGTGRPRPLSIPNVAFLSCLDIVLPFLGITVPFGVELLMGIFYLIDKHSKGDVRSCSTAAGPDFSVTLLALNESFGLISMRPALICHMRASLPWISSLLSVLSGPMGGDRGRSALGSFQLTMLAHFMYLRI